jgi:Fe-S cluster assembly ATP-binding protein
VSELVVEGLRASAAGKEILRGVELRIGSGEVHALMGPNGSGKSTLSHVLAGRPGYEVTAGSIRLDGTELLGRPAWERAQAGLFLALQYPIEVPGVSVYQALEEAVAAAGSDRAQVRELVGAEARRVGLDESILLRSLNVDLSGGERKRNEILQLAVLQPKVAVLDEIDSGLDIDALKAVSRRVAQLATEDGIGVLAITHYQRLLQELAPSQVHVLAGGRVVQTGGPELALELERTGYAAYGGDTEEMAGQPAGRRPRALE